MNERKDSTINVDRNTLTTLQKISELSGYPIAQILRQIATGFQMFVDERNPDRLNFMVSMEKNVVVIRLGAMYCGKTPIPSSLSEKAQNFVEHEMVDAHIEKRKRNRK